MRFLFVACVLVLFLSCKEEGQKKKLAVKSDESSIQVVDFEGLEPYLKAGQDKTYVVNFWATWCAPCVKELPYFKELDASYTDDQLSLTFVSLDFPAKLESKLIPFVEKYGIKDKVVLLDAPNENEWIPKVDSGWSGAIPATLIFNKNKRAFYEQSFTKEQLFKEVEKFIK